MPGPALVLDACIVITFGNEEQLELVAGSSRRVVISARAEGEVARPPARSELDRALDAETIEVEGIDLDDPREQEALTRYDEKPAFRGRGDAEVLALATSRGYVVASDDQAIRRQVIRDLGPDRIAGTLDLVVWAVRDGRLSRTDAQEFLRTCDVGAALLEALRQKGQRLDELW